METRWKFTIAMTGFLIGTFEFGGLGFIVGSFGGSGFWWYGMLWGGFLGGIWFGTIGYQTATLLIKYSRKQERIFKFTYLVYWIIVSGVGALLASITSSEAKQYALKNGAEEVVGKLDSWEGIGILGCILGFIGFGVILRKIRNSDFLQNEINKTRVSKRSESIILAKEEDNVLTPLAKKLHQNIDTEKVHEGEPCPFCGYSKYHREGSKTFLCVDCRARFTIVSDKTDPFYFCTGHKVVRNKTMKNVLLSNEDADTIFPMKTVMINKSTKN